MPVYILAAARTPLGAFGGRLKEVDSTELAAHALRETLLRGCVSPDRVAEVILGCALPGRRGLNSAPAAAKATGLSRIPAFSLWAGSASGLKAVALAAQSLQHGCEGFVLAGGTESSSQAPYLLPDARWGVRFGEADLLDSLLAPGPTAAHCAEAITQKHQLRAEDLAAWIERSHRKAHACRHDQAPEIAPLTTMHRKTALVMCKDEVPEHSLGSSLPPDLAPPADGAAALLLASSIPADSPPPLARILDWVETGGDAAGAVRRLLRRTGLGFQQIDHWEIHETSSAQVLAVLKDLPELDPDRVNPRGGALALGDPLGASGARLVATLAYALQRDSHQTGIVLIPGNGGPDIAMAISRT